MQVRLRAPEKPKGMHSLGSVGIDDSRLDRCDPDCPEEEAAQVGSSREYGRADGLT
jgi:hypothetical protein